MLEVEDPGDGEIDQSQLKCDSPIVDSKELLMNGPMVRCDESTFWYFINERHQVYLNKRQGLPKPWTIDPILQKWKFCNVFRRLDRTTVWFLENFLKSDDDPAIIAFNCCWFRMFNRIETGKVLGWRQSWDSRQVYDVLSAVKYPVFTGAYIVHSEPGEAKLDSIIQVCAELWRLCTDDDSLVALIRESNSMEATWQALQVVRHVGPFLAYEMVCDMRYTKLLRGAVDAMAWANVGPGARRGLMRLGMPAGSKTGIESMKDLLERSPQNLRSNVPPLEMREIEHVLCEVDKYCRVKFGEGHPRSTYPGVRWPTR